MVLFGGTDTNMVDEIIDPVIPAVQIKKYLIMIYYCIDPHFHLYNCNNMKSYMLVIFISFEFNATF